ncbi:phosphatase domain-containing putative toxin [Nioella nitratireducens]|uniref:phosphatase domain-containing putative toxin n=1 Tax=Nioella nitratireducens TaxID=1287720 RepID=UPI0008FD7236|nr:protein-tyrosine phosphatase family protein [Nioella nitratireducens]
MSGFSVAELRVAGGTLGISPLPGRDGAYADDLEGLLSWRPGVVLSLTSEDEMQAKGACTLGPDLAGQGIAWRHFPVVDFSVPKARDRTVWTALSAEIHSGLGQGARILIHCHGGCGRSGMILLRLMVEAGEAPDGALTRLRAVRPCAVETDMQLMWATEASRMA